jgi:hypothetical protein
MGNHEFAVAVAKYQNLEMLIKKVQGVKTKPRPQQQPGEDRYPSSHHGNRSRSD